MDKFKYFEYTPTPPHHLYRYESATFLVKNLFRLRVIRNVFELRYSRAMHTIPLDALGLTLY